MTQSLVHVGIGGHVVALRPEDGSEAWRTKLPRASGAGLIALATFEGRLYAGVGGRVHCLDPVTGQLLWSNPLKGLGVGWVTFAGVPGSGAAAAQAAAAAATTAAVMAATSS